MYLPIKNHTVPCTGAVKSRLFTLIELLVSKTCQIGVLPLYYLKKENMPILSCILSVPAEQ